MMFIENVPCYARHKSKGVHHIAKVLITIINATMGIESRNNQKIHPEGLQAFSTLQRCTAVSTQKSGLTSISVLE
jgi:hypothetical protein